MWPFKKKDCQSQTVKKIEKCTGCDIVIENESECNKTADGSCLCKDCAAASKTTKK